MKSRSRLVAAIVVAALSVTACTDDATKAVSTTDKAPATTEKAPTTKKPTTTKPAAESTAAAGEQNIVEVASGDENFSILVAAVKKADLVDALSGEGEFTVFAPTDAAFEKFLKEADLTQEELLADPNLADILKYHVLKTKVDSKGAKEAAEKGASVDTLQGGKLELSLEGDKIKVANATVVTPDVAASNGVIHGVDAVIPLPK